MPIHHPPGESDCSINSTSERPWRNSASAAIRRYELDGSTVLACYMSDCQWVRAMRHGLWLVGVISCASLNIDCGYQKFQWILDKLQCIEGTRPVGITAVFKGYWQSLPGSPLRSFDGRQIACGQGFVMRLWKSLGAGWKGRGATWQIDRQWVYVRY